MITFFQLVYILVVILLTVMTVVGNALILAAVRLNPKLRQIHASVLITSLAAADLLVGATVMPMAVVDLWTGGRWLLGPLICRLWTSMDVVCSTASITTLCLISIDRYIGITKPLEYSFLVTRKRLWFAVILAWLFSLTVLLTCMKLEPILNIESSINYNNSTINNISVLKIDLQQQEPIDQKCHVGDQLNYIIYSIFLSFFFPLSIMLFVNFRMYRLTVLRNKRFVRTDKNVIMRICSRVENDHLCKQLDEHTKKIKLRPPKKIKLKNEKNRNLRNEGHYFKGYQNQRSGADRFSPNSTADKQTLKKFRRQYKAAFTTVLIVGLFVFCWLPFFTLFMIKTPTLNFEELVTPGPKKVVRSPAAIMAPLHEESSNDEENNMVITKKYNERINFYLPPIEFKE
uniref:G-protein coupled receptors family 1 profile domain-containing protein n=1 Tax=Romanomermis culicivorax TaxID=13658 RepID=A0A915HJT9_ROMCU